MKVFMSRPFVILGVDEHGERLADPDGRRHRRGIRKLADLQVHPAVHHALPREPHLLVVQHLYLEGLELDPLRRDASARPLAVDLAGRVPDLLHVGVHLDDDDVGEDGGHLAHGGGGGEKGGQHAVLFGVRDGGERRPALGHGDGEDDGGHVLAWVEISADRWQGREKKGGCVHRVQKFVQCFFCNLQQAVFLWNTLCFF